MVNQTWLSGNATAGHRRHLAKHRSIISSDIWMNLPGERPRLTFQQPPTYKFKGWMTSDDTSTVKLVYLLQHVTAETRCARNPSVHMHHVFSNIPEVPQFPGSCLIRSLKAFLICSCGAAIAFSQWSGS